MKAIVMDRFGDADVLETRTVDTPRPRAGELLIRIEAAGLNRLDHYIREGSVTPDLPFPFILGSDAVGTVAELGEGVSGFEVGDRVIPMPGYPTDANDDGGEVMSASPSYAIRGIAENGSYAEYMTVPARWTLKDNTGLPAVEVATLPMPLVTAVRAVKTVGEVKAGDKVLIHAGASGTGSTMIQVAKALGAEVAVTLRSESKTEFVKSLGADLVVLSSASDYVQQIQEWSGGGADVVIDNLGGPSLAQSLEMSKPLGVVVLMGNVLGLESSLQVRSVFFPQRQIRGTLMGDVADLEWGLEQVRLGSIKPSLDRTFTLEEAVEAHAMLAKGDAAGNLVFDIQ
ncbi:quinone oxidoreductase family protein [Pseudoteredinibacter isoporae]|uniref:NADPH:quinone reductase-like Zn-dependent oxidoreductase n=1 Tax=Pseudoteredinibacter isoporae TaxID=570281 RepID=A0A7X0JTW4_9GAMM|nr:zinc-binding alcohol dehydrogenase family protein [Pseudoteredinibacter isoporae]MBB6521744.1 NADPH:quinone reductase-like Zn-dependent oxidoreductase [Pseudoteredinibacter isoporae]NHO87292.1 zinc-binding alcohol dehydrogenase family protein [Pseudoteredinibacter isoporae]NIB23076.1 zinc-binding alcohol dehydrogenase family protein [Pseudoteredinibacter isoporae]